MRICIDSNQFIFGIGGADPASETLMSLLPGLEVVLPRLVIKEVSRNLTESQTKTLFSFPDETEKRVTQRKSCKFCLRITGQIDNPIGVNQPSMWT